MESYARDQLAADVEVVAAVEEGLDGVPVPHAANIVVMASALPKRPKCWAPVSIIARVASYGSRASQVNAIVNADVNPANGRIGSSPSGKYGGLECER